MVSPRRPLGVRADQARRAASPTARSTSRPTSRAASRRRCSGAAIASKCRAPTRTGRSPRSASTPAGTPKRAPTRPTCWRSRSTSRSTSRARPMTVAVTARTAGRVTLNVMGDRLLSSITQEVQARHRAASRVPVGRDWGTGAYVVATLRRPLDAKAQRMPGRAIGVQWFSIDRKAQTLALDMKLPPLQRPNTTLARADQDRRPRRGRGGPRRRRRRRCRHPQSHQLQAAGAGRLLSRPAPAHRRAARSLRPAHRRHAGHARPDQDRRRRRRRAERQSAVAGAARALFRHRHRARRTAPPRSSFEIPAFAGTVRVMAVAWSKDKVGRAVGDVTVRDPVVLTATLAALPADRRPRHDAPRPRQRRGSGRRLQLSQ